jgi:hypothetical protein
VLWRSLSSSLGKSFAVALLQLTDVLQIPYLWAGKLAPLK